MHQSDYCVEADIAPISHALTIVLVVMAMMAAVATITDGRDEMVVEAMIVVVVAVAMMTAVG